MTSLTLRRAAVEGHDSLVSVHIRDGVITGVSEEDDHRSRRPATEVIDLEGRVLVSAFAEPHLHLDKALLGSPPGGATLPEAIAATAERKRSFTEADVLDRALDVARQAISHGTTIMRAHTEVDPTVGLISVDAVSRLAERLAGVLDVRLAILPQEGILCRPGTLELLRAALDRPGTVVGGCPYVEGSLDDARAHIDIVLDLAERYGTPADLHLDFADDTRDARQHLASYLAKATIARGLNGRVTIGHATSLGSLTHDQRGPILDELAAADIAVVLLPATDLYLMGRSDDGPVRRGLAPLRDLWSRGIRTAISSNNIRNAFTPTGSADPLDIALLTARVTHLVSQDDFARVLAMCSTAAAEIIDPDSRRGVAVGAVADLVALDSRDLATVIHDQPDRTLVLARGRVVYREQRERTWPEWPSST